MRQFFVLCAAAALLASVSGSAHAIRVFVGDAPPQLSPGANETQADALKASTDYSDSVTYAKETLLSTETTSVTGDTTKYYTLAAPHQFSFPLMRQIQATTGGSATVYVIVTLDGMVFSGNTTPDLLGFADAQEDPLTGGTSGTKTVAWAVSGAATVNANQVLTIEDAMLAVSEGGGSISIEVRDSRLAVIGLPASESHSSNGLGIKVASALDETVTPNSMTPLAKADEAFMEFEGGHTAVSLGTIKLSYKAMHLDAQSATGAPVDAFIDTADNMGITVPNAEPAPAENPVMLTGSVAFVGEDGMFGLWEAMVDDGATDDIDESQVCRVITDILEREEGVPTGEIEAQMASQFDQVHADANETEGLMHVCLMVDGETVIPETSPIMVSASYKGLANAAFPPMGASMMLSGIDRDGANFQLPYLTSLPKFAQRLVIVNRGAATTYEIRMADADSTLLDSGDLPQGQTTLKIWEILTGEVSSAAATLTVVADDSMIDAALTLVQRDTQAIDTEHLMAE
jgi:hypothetical protein